MKTYKSGMFSTNRDFIAAFHRGIITIVAVTDMNEKLVNVFFKNSEASFPESGKTIVMNKSMLTKAGVI